MWRLYVSAESCVWHLIYLGNLNDGPKDGEEQAKKPTVAPFESQCMYSVSVTFKRCDGWSLILPSNFISVYRYFNCIIVITVMNVYTCASKNDWFPLEYSSIRPNVNVGKSRSRFLQRKTRIKISSVLAWGNFQLCTTVSVTLANKNCMSLSYQIQTVSDVMAKSFKFKSFRFKSQNNYFKCQKKNQCNTQENLKSSMYDQN